MKQLRTRLAFSILVLVPMAGCEEAMAPAVDLDEPPAAAAVVFAGDVAPGVVTPLVVDDYWQWWPAIDGDKVVWSDNRVRGTGYWRWDTFLLDLSTGVETQVTPTDWTVASHPDVSGSRAVWMDTRHGGGHDIYMYDADTGVETRITPSPGQRGYPAISGDRIVWEEGPAGARNIVLHDLNTGVTSQITHDPADQSDPDISGDVVTWTDLRFGANYPHIYTFDIGTGVERQWVFGYQTGEDPSISGDTLIWRSPGCRCVLGRTNLTVGPPIRIGTGNSQYFPRLSGGVVVWLDTRHGNADIYAYDMATGVETRITTDPSDQMYPAVSGRQVVWSDKRNGNYDLYTYVLPPNNEPPVAVAGDDLSVVRSSPEGAEVTLDGSASSDPDGVIVSYEWLEEGVLIAEGATATVTLGLGIHALTLRVTDDYGEADEDEVVVEVQNAVPVAHAGTDQTALVTLPMTFDGSASYDVDSDISFHWDFGDGSSGEDVVATHSYLAAGVYPVVLTVTDVEGATATATVSATVLTPSEATQAIIDHIDDLVAAAILGAQDARGPRAKASQAKDHLDSGRNGPAVNKLRDFIDQINALVNSNRLKQEEADALIRAANDIIGVIGS